MDSTSSATGTTTGITATVNTSTGSAGLAGISGDDFMNILVKQLQMQDPFKPMTNEEMVQQLSTIRELEMNTRMSSKLEQLTDQQRFGSAAALIGRRVKGTTKDADGNEYAMEGTVVGIRFTESGEVMLDLDTGDTLPLTALQTVTNPASTTTSGTSQNTTTARIIK